MVPLRRRIWRRLQPSVFVNETQVLLSQK